MSGARPENLLLYLEIGSVIEKFTIRPCGPGYTVKAMTRNSIDVASRVSPHLSALLRSRIDNPECEQPVTLMAVRRFLGDLLPADFSEAERMHHFDVSESLLDELDALIEEFGAAALAVYFTQAAASESLSRAIEAVINDGNRENPPTLAAIRDAILAGLAPGWLGTVRWKTTRATRCCRKSKR